MKTDLTQSRKDAKTKRDSAFCLSSPLCAFAALRETLCLVIAAWCLAFVAGSDANAQEKPTRASGDKAIEARRILKQYCGECHGKDYKSHPAGSQLSILNHTQLTSPANPTHPLPFVKAKDAKNSHLLELIECGSMPPGGRKRPSEAEVTKLREWIETAAPAYPVEFNDRYVLEQILADYESKPQDAEFVRYLSFGHMIVNDQIPGDWLAMTQRHVNQPLTRISNKGGLAEPIDACATVYRIDLRDSGLLKPDQFLLLEEGKPKGVAPLNPYDLVLNEYPFGFILPEADALGQRLKPFLKDARLSRPIPFVRGDWFTNSLTNRPDKPMAVGEPTPLAIELQDLVQLGSSKKGMEPLKASEPDLFKNAKPVSSLPTPEGWQPIPPLSAVYSFDVADAKLPFKLDAEVINSSGEPIISIASGMPFRFKLSCEKPVFFTMIRVMPEGDIRPQTVSANKLFDGGKSVILRPNPKDSSELFFKASLPEGKDVATEYFIILASEADIPLSSLQFVCSKHTNAPIFRFLFDPPDPTKVVRKVLPFKVTAK